ncbi:MAG TPA: glycosyltransferase family 39 protein [Gemmataceae bacterium]|nr:glycosyltransferase family 39 protein [Gemmataceae bacterium]
MPVLLPVLCFLLLWAAFARRGTGGGARAAFLAAALTWGVFVVALTEGLSLFGLLTRNALAVGWAAAALAAAAALRGAPAVRRPSARPDWVAGLFAAAAAAVLGVTLVVALAAPPNTYDAMTYHLARVAHWAQDRAVGFYPTHCPRQLHMPPWAEYALAHLLLLAGGDRPANLVQWFSTAGAVLGVSLLAARLGAGPRGQAFSALFCATLPMGVLQASSTQNDAVLAFWLVCLAYHVLRLHKRPAWGNALGAGAGLGLALLTKGTAYLFAAPLVAWLLFAWLWRYRGRAWAPLAVAGLLALALNLPHYGRNWRLYGSPLGPGAEHAGRFPYRNQVISAAALASNVLRNLALHLRLPSRQVNRAVEGQVIALHGLLGLGADDPRTTWAALPFRLTSDTERDQRLLARHEDHAANLPHLLLVGLGAAAGLWGAAGRPGRAAGLGAAVLLASLLFCLLLRWQPWHSRLHLPLFVLCSPLVAVGLGRLRPAGATGAAALLLAWSWPFLVENALRPASGEGAVFRAPRLAQYFASRPDLAGPYFEAVAFLRSRGCKEVGWLGDEESWEYPFWALLTGARPRGCRLEAVGVDNPSAALGRGRAPFRPDALVVINHGDGAERRLDGRVYRKALTAGAVYVYLPVTDEGAPSGAPCR